jgi:hypothetical protein
MMNVRKGELLPSFLIYEPTLRLPFKIIGPCLATNNSLSLLLSTNNQVNTLESNLLSARLNCNGISQSRQQPAHKASQTQYKSSE